MTDLTVKNHQHAVAIDQMVQWLVDPSSTRTLRRRGAVAEVAFQAVDTARPFRRQRIQFTDGTRRMSEAQISSKPRYEGVTTMQASVYGRIGEGPRSIDTKSGKAMAVASVAVAIDFEVSSLWVGIVAFDWAFCGRHTPPRQRRSHQRCGPHPARHSRHLTRAQLHIIEDSVISS
jgi:hypothetical protein